MSQYDKKSETNDELPRIIVRCIGKDEISEVEYIEYGIEEEGVPWTVQQGYEGDSTVVAHSAAADSPLKVGVSITPELRVVVHHQQLDSDAPVFDISKVTAETARKLGSNSARLAKGTPFKLIE